MSESLAAAAAEVTPVTIFRRLFENEFVTLEGFAISCRMPGRMRYLDERDAIARLLETEAPDAPSPPSDPALHALHEGMYTAWPDVQAAVSGISLHLRALMDEGMDLPAPTSMMRKRGVNDLREHLVAPAALAGASLSGTLGSAQAAAVRNGMRHVLLVTTEGRVHVAGPSAAEAMAHFSNVEFAARVECLRLEELSVHRSGG